MEFEWSNLEWSEPKKSSSPKFEQYTSCKYNGSKYSVYFTSELGGNDKAQVSVLKPYDDADYYWAQLNKGSIEFIKSGRILQRYDYLIESKDQELHDEDFNDALEFIVRRLDELNDDIESKIVTL